VDTNLLSRMDSDGELMINMLMNAKQTIMNNNDDLNRLIKQVNLNINANAIDMVDEKINIIEQDSSNMIMDDLLDEHEMMADLMFDSESSEDENHDDNNQMVSFLFFLVFRVFRFRIYILIIITYYLLIILNYLTKIPNFFVN
jgi:hypothetical protein